MKNQHHPYERIVLPNGVRIMLVPMESVNSIATSVMVGVGSRYEKEEWNGISHFLEHMVFKGTTTFPTTDDVNEIERIGGLQNAYTGIDITNFHNKVFADDWKFALEINKELALHPLLLETHVDKERDVIIEEMKRYEDQPDAKAEEAFHMMLYPNTKLGMRIIGQEKNLRNVASHELKEYHDSLYSPEKIVVVLAGNINGLQSKSKSQDKTMVETITEWFGSLEKKQSVPLEKVNESQEKPNVLVVTKPDAQQAHMVLGFRSFARGNEERFAWTIFNLLFGVGFTSKLFKEVREKRGLCYHISSNSDSYDDVGNWSIYAGVATDKVEETISAIMEEISKILVSGVSNEDVLIAKKRLKTMLSFKSENPEFMNEFYGRQELYNQPLLTFHEYLEKFDTVTVEDINIYIRKYLIPTTVNMAVVWNKKSGEEELKKLLVLH
jgi:predicted Zn-dependent peptidase